MKKEKYHPDSLAQHKILIQSREEKKQTAFKCKLMGDFSAIVEATRLNAIVKVLEEKSPFFKNEGKIF